MFSSPNGINPLSKNMRPLSKRFFAPLSILLFLSLLLYWHAAPRAGQKDTGHSSPAPPPSQSPATKSEQWKILPEDQLATRVWPDAILSRPLASGSALYTIPQYIHQSWSDDQLPTRMSRWCQTCRNLHQHWEWILWTDEDNLRMVKTYFPWFLKTYRALPAEINRADAARNMYMYLFGGVYADLDTECLQPVDKLFQKHNVALTGHPLYLPNDLSEGSASQKAFFGSMGYDGTDSTLKHTIPNAWFAAPPGHPFFLFVLHKLKSAMSSPLYSLGFHTAEGLTGPVALYEAIEEYNRTISQGVSDIDLTGNPSYAHFNHDSHKVALEVLPPVNIYPYAWNNAGKEWREQCWSGSGGFNSGKCKDALATEETYTITYWSHSWSEDLQKAHDPGLLAALEKGMNND